MSQKIEWHNDSEMVNLRSVIETLCYMTDEDSDGVEEILQLPRIDLVRCKECKYLAVETEDEGTSWYYCTPNGHEVDETDFCSWGKREGSE